MSTYFHSKTVYPLDPHPFSFGGTVKSRGKKSILIFLTAALLTALLCSACSSTHQASRTPEPVLEAEGLQQVVSSDAAQDASTPTIAPTPQPDETDAAPTPSPTATPPATDPPAYQEVRKQCKFYPTNNRSEFFYARDVSMESVWRSYPGEQSITIEVQSDVDSIAGFYFNWDAPPPTWNLYAYDSAGKETLADSGGGNCGWTEFAQVPASMSNYKTFKLEATNPEIAFAIANLSVYSGAIPEFVPRWESYNGDRMDLLVIAAHPDDECVFLGAPAATYVNEGKTAVTGYMTWGTSDRRYEAEEACWMLGEQYAPTMRAAHDMMANSLESMEQYWPLDKAVGYIVELIRKYKPSVIVTHDIGGEYGHGAHMETSLATQLAFAQASDPTKYPESAAKYGVWTAGKLYLHMYEKDPLSFDLNAPLDKFHGETVLETVSAAFHRHRSQEAKGWALETTGKCSMEYFGLFASNVGPDKIHDSMFENITQSVMDSINGISLP